MPPHAQDPDIKFASLSFAGVDYELAYRPADADVVAEELVRGRNPNDWIVRLLSKFAKRGSRVLDIGANIGCFAIPAAALGYEIAAFEAAPTNAAALGASIAKNRITSLSVVQAAVSDSAAEVTFLANGPTGHVTTGEATASTIRVPGVVIDQYLSDRGWDDVSFIKMDIEGSEPAALRGMRKLLSGPKAPAFVFESNATTLSRVGASPADVMRQFAEFDYSLYLITPGYFTELTAIELPYQQPAQLIDCLAVKGRVSWLGRHNWAMLPSRIMRRLGLRR